MSMSVVLIFRFLFFFLGNLYQSSFVLHVRPYIINGNFSQIQTMLHEFLFLNIVNSLNVTVGHCTLLLKYLYHYLVVTILVPKF